jgi:acetyltransferase-like isoleucine patch superfamily enzyme
MGLFNSIKYRISLGLRKLNLARYRIMGVSVGKDVFISWGAYIDTCYHGSIEVGDKTYITNGAKLIAHDHSVYRLPPDDTGKSDDGRGRISLGKGVFVGAGAIILRNVTVGDNSIISAGSVVGKDVPANVVVMGNPARVIKDFSVK